MYGNGQTAVGALTSVVDQTVSRLVFFGIGKLSQNDGAIDKVTGALELLGVKIDPKAAARNIAIGTVVAGMATEQGGITSMILNAVGNVAALKAGADSSSSPQITSTPAPEISTDSQTSPGVK